MTRPPPDYEIDAPLIGEFGPESAMRNRTGAPGSTTMLLIALKDMASDFNRACDFPENRAALDALARIGTDQPAQRCAECTCEHGGADCNWIMAGSVPPERPEVTVGEAACERVARALCHRHCNAWHDLDPEDINGYLADADAAIRALAQEDKTDG